MAPTNAALLHEHYRRQAKLIDVGPVSIEGGIGRNIVLKEREIPFMILQERNV